MDWLQSQSIKNFLRLALGVRLYGRLGRIIRPKKVVGAYGDRRILSPSEGSEWLLTALNEGRPVAAGKIGASELRAMRAVLGTPSKKSLPDPLLHELHLHSGVFPAASESLRSFVDVYCPALSEIDLLAVWFNQGEQAVVDQWAPQATLARLLAFDSYFHAKPWTHGLAGKRVVVVSPFARSIEQQYARRQEVWAKVPWLLPEFELQTVRAPLSDYLVPSSFPNWTAAFHDLRDRLLSQTFDVALIGAGAFSLPLVAAAKVAGRSALHLGGTTQIIFGVRGGRWDVNEGFSSLMTDAWVRPSGDEVPSSFRKMEGGCYW